MKAVQAALQADASKVRQVLSMCLRHLRIIKLWQQTVSTHRCGEAVVGGRADS
jgi:hypothetical protein